MDIPAAELEAMIIYQIGALKAMAAAEGSCVSHVKPHGALSNMACADPALADCVARAVHAISPQLILLAPAYSRLATAGERIGLPVILEIFADRAYQDDGQLMPRSQPGAMIHGTDAALAHVLRMLDEQAIVSVNGKRLPTRVQSICVHGDNPEAVQSTLLPELLDDYIAEANPVRVVDVYVDELDLGKLGFEGVDPAATGRPAYHPAVLLKIYIYGYLNRIQSSRRLERKRNATFELMWLTSRLMPDFKTIANFRKDNGKAIRSVCRQFVMLCQQLGLFSEALVAIDGSKFKAVNNRDRNFTSAKLQRRMEEIESSINRYLTALDTADRQEPAVAKLKERTATRQDRRVESADEGAQGH
jgi:transposase